ncbi:MAG: hypothetical protein DRR08_21980 [Candidatus Parabeggiatoa sp. nov. 2]|nr:MAG: hypothetical protein DRR08_21980 [Gammaproteobacteria bacterium]
MAVTNLILDEASDRQILQYAKTPNYTIVSKDEDFFQLANSPQDNTPALVWVRLGNCRKATLIAVFRKVLPDLL